MALAHAAQVLASTTNAASATTTSSWFPTNAGVSGVAKITNGGTGPTVECQFVIEVSSDNGVTSEEFTRRGSGVASGATYRLEFGLGIGSGADLGYWRAKFTGNTSQSVTVECYAGTTTV